MFQGAGTPHYPYGPPRQPGFDGNDDDNDNNAMSGQFPGTGTRQSLGNAANGFHINDATNGQPTGFGTGQSPDFGAAQSLDNATNGQFDVLDRRTMVPALLPRGNVQTDHLQSIETQFQTDHLQSPAAQFPSSILQSAHVPTNDIMSLNGYGIATFSKPPESDTVPSSKKSKKGQSTTLDRKQLMKSTAGSLVGGGAASYFICPLQSCAERLDPEATLELWDHCSDLQHRMGLFEQGHYRCELGCEEGFADPVHRLSHYGKARCTDEELPDDKCFEVGCNWTSTQSSGKRIQSVRAEFLDHYVKKHAPGAYNKPDAPFRDNTCKLGFRSKATLFYHIVVGCAARGTLLGRNRVSGHRNRVLEEFNAGANIVSDGSRPIDNDLLAIFPLEIRGEHVKYDPIMCRPAGASPSSQRVVQDGDWIL